MSSLITASMLYDMVCCPHRLSMDLFEDSSRRDPTSKFVQLLWEKGTIFEQEVLHSLSLPYTNLKELSLDERERETTKAISRHEPLIYGARIRYADLLGEPDLLRWQQGGYVAVDIKSGAGKAGGDDLGDGKPKKHYGVQLGLYTEILERLGIAAGRIPFIWDINGNEVAYDLDAPQGPRTPESLWVVYKEASDQARKIVHREDDTRPALQSECKLCHWKSACLKEVMGLDDLTLIPGLGRSKRDVMYDTIPTVKVMASTDIKQYISGRKTVFQRIGSATLRKIQARARLQVSGGKPYSSVDFELPKQKTELFFDVETDPMRDVCYLHGFVEREDGDCSSERYYAFFADSPTKEDEERAFSEAFSFINERLPCAIYFYSSYEKTTWMKLSRKYPTVASEDDVRGLFDDINTVDLYNDVVRPKTIWPTRDHSIKTLATFLGFEWRDKSPSGADSIEWFHRWVDSREESIRQRILEYNEDDCRAMRVLADGLRDFPNR